MQGADEGQTNLVYLLGFEHILHYFIIGDELVLVLRIHFHSRHR
jgi:hypothetical protein